MEEIPIRLKTAEELQAELIQQVTGRFLAERQVKQLRGALMQVSDLIHSECYQDAQRAIAAALRESEPPA